MPHSHIPIVSDFTLHVCAKFLHGEHQCASRCWCSPTQHTTSRMHVAHRSCACMMACWHMYMHVGILPVCICSFRAYGMLVYCACMLACFVCMRHIGHACWHIVPACWHAVHACCMLAYCLHVGIVCLHIGILCMHVGILCMHVGIVCLHVGILCMHVGILCLHVGMVCPMNAIVILEMLCMLNLTQFTPHTTSPGIRN